MNYLPREFIDLVIEQVDVLDVISYFGIDYGTITPKGDTKICCPFHDDSNPSCSVSVTQKLYHCWSCGASGNVVDFMVNAKPYAPKAYGEIPFPVAIKVMASLSGIDELDDGDIINLNIDQFYRSIEKKKDTKVNRRKNIDIMNYTISSFLGEFLSRHPDKLSSIEEIYRKLDEMVDEENLDGINNLWAKVPKLAKQINAS